jgi:hypothetical protein
VNRCPSDLELERHLLGDGTAVTAHLGVCASCAARLEEMKREGEVFQREVFPVTVDAVVARSRPNVVRLPRRWSLIVAPLSAAAAAAILFLAVRPPPGYVGLKGDGLGLAVYVQTAYGAHAARDGEAVAAAANVRFQVRPARACRLWIVSIDASGEVSRLFPAAGDAAGELGSAATLPGGARLDGRAGPERLYAVCSPRPLPYEEVERAVRAAAAGGEAAVRAARALPGLPSEAAQATVLLEKRL